MKISRDDVLRVARLARLELGDDEAAAFTTQLDAILEYVETLKGLDTAGVEPTAHIGDAATPLREDQPRPSLPREVALAAAPKAAGGAFVVPKTVDVGS